MASRHDGGSPRIAPQCAVSCCLLGLLSSETSTVFGAGFSGTFSDAYVVVPSLNYKFSDGPQCNYLAFRSSPALDLFAQSDILKVTF